MIFLEFGITSAQKEIHFSIFEITIFVLRNIPNMVVYAKSGPFRYQINICSWIALSL